VCHHVTGRFVSCVVFGFLVCSRYVPPHLRSFNLVIVDSVRYLVGFYVLVCSFVVYVTLSLSGRFRALPHILFTMPTMPLNDYTNDLHSFRYFLLSSCISPSQSSQIPKRLHFLIIIVICFAFRLHVTRARAWIIVQYHSYSLAYPIMHCKFVDY
jgi:hypothetical protein